MTTSHDPHLNTFYYYSGRRLAGSDHDRQIEDNTTKALINTLKLSVEHSSADDLLRPFLSWAGVKNSSTEPVHFALQRQTIGVGPLRRAREKVLLGIAPKMGSNDADSITREDRASRPDAWIWGREYVVAIETKIAGTFDPRQLSAHERTLGSSGIQRQTRTWSDVFAFLTGRLQTLEASREARVVTALLGELIQYLRILAYQKDIDMEPFGGFSTDVFDAFVVLEDDEAEDTRKEALHALETFVRALQAGLPTNLQEFGCLTTGVIRARARHVWATLSRLERPVDEPHFSFAIGPEGFSIRLLLEGNKPTIAARRAISDDPDRFLSVLQNLRDYKLVLNRRWQKQAQNYESTSACMIDLDAVGQEDVEYLLRKMEALKRKETARGFFEIHVQREFPRDSKVLRSREFVSVVTEEMMKLAVADRFLSGD